MSSRKVPPIPPSTRLSMTPPVILFEYEEDGVKYYVTEGDRKWQADIYEKVFVPKKLKVLARSTDVNLSREFNYAKRNLKPNR